jgi:hypothetical protein
MTNHIDRQGELCAAILTELQRCGIDARYEATKYHTVLTISHGWHNDLIDFKSWSSGRQCWFGISFRLADVDELLESLRRIGYTQSAMARSLFDATARRIAER